MVTLTDKQRRLLDHVFRFRITTAQVVRNLFYGGEGESATKSFLSRLVKTGYLASADLYRINTVSYVYYHLTRKALNHVFDADPRKAGPFTPAVLGEAYGILDFCCGGDTKRVKIMDQELASEWPELSIPKMNHRNYYRDSERGKIECLGYLYVDRGSTSSQILHKLRTKVFLPRWESKVWRKELLETNPPHFAIAVVTHNQVKAGQLEKRVLGDPRLSKLRFRIHVRPELNFLILRDAA